MRASLRSLLGVVIAVGVLAGLAVADDAPSTGAQKPPAGAPASQPAVSAPAGAPAGAAETQPAVVYDPNADARADLAAARIAAKHENTRVLLMFGGNWCTWCRKLHALFKDNKEIAGLLGAEYELVLVDVGRAGEKNADITSSCGLELKKTGVPVLVVQEPDGRTLTVQETGSLEAGGTHDPKKVKDFLVQWQAPRRDAEQVLIMAKARAKTEGRLLFVHLTAPWCKWCRQLDAFLTMPETAKLMESGFVDVRIDVDRMTNGKTVAARVRGTEKGGIPWCAVLDETGKVLAKSENAEGNIDYPMEAPEIDVFLKMLGTPGSRLTADQLKRLGELLKVRADEINKAAGDKH